MSSINPPSESNRAIVLVSGGSNPSAGKSAWGSGFLPSKYQGVALRSAGDPVLYLSNPEGIDPQILEQLKQTM